MATARTTEDRTTRRGDERVVRVGGPLAAMSEANVPTIFIAGERAYKLLRAAIATLGFENHVPQHGD